MFRENAQVHAREDKQDTDGEQGEHKPLVQEILQVFVRFHRHDAVIIDGKTILQHQDDEPGHEEQQEGNSGYLERAAHLLPNSVVVHIVQDIQRAHDDGQEDHREAQQDGMSLPEGLQAVPGALPGTDHRGCRIRNGGLVHGEGGAREEGAHGRAHQERGQDAVREQRDAEARHAQQIAFLILELV